MLRLVLAGAKCTCRTISIYGRSVLEDWVGGEFTYQQIWRVHWKEQVACKEGDPEEGSLGKETSIALYVVVDLILCFEVGDDVFPSRDLAGVGERTPDVVVECWGC